MALFSFITITCCMSMKETLAFQPCHSSAVPRQLSPLKTESWPRPAARSLSFRRRARPRASCISASEVSSDSNIDSNPENDATDRQRPSLFLTYPLTQVVSDIDDTIKSSGGVTVAGVPLGGIDVQYARGEFYPGVFQFMWELSLYSVTMNQRYYDDYLLEGGWNAGEKKAIEEEEGGRLIPPKVAVLTARAEEFKAALEIKEKSKLAQAFRKTGESSTVLKVNDWGIGPVLYGSVSEWIIQYRKGLRKFNNFERLLEQDPTGQIMQYIYVGDTGELDQEAGETMLREYPEVVQAVFLHIVSSDPPSSFSANGLPIPAPKLINGRPLVFFRTYVGAAAKATQLGLMEGDGLMRIVEEAEKALAERGVPRTSDKWIDLERDVEEAYNTLGMVLY